FSWSCPGPPPPAMVVYRACDGFISCESVERWLRARDGAQAETAYLRLGAGNDEEPSCAPRNQCTPKRAEGNHLRRPQARGGDVPGVVGRPGRGGAGRRGEPPRGDPPGGR